MQFFYVSLTAYFNRIKLLTACVNKIKAIDHTGVFGIIFICWILSCLILKNYFSVTIFAVRPILFFILAVYMVYVKALCFLVEYVSPCNRKSFLFSGGGG